MKATRSPYGILTLRSAGAVRAAAGRSPPLATPDGSALAFCSMNHRYFLGSDGLRLHCYLSIPIQDGRRELTQRVSSGRMVILSQRSGKKSDKRAAKQLVFLRTQAASRIAFRELQLKLHAAAAWCPWRLLYPRDVTWCLWWLLPRAASRARPREANRNVLSGTRASDRTMLLSCTCRTLQRRWRLPDQPPDPRRAGANRQFGALIGGQPSPVGAPSLEGRLAH